MTVLVPKLGHIFIPIGMDKQAYFLSAMADSKEDVRAELNLEDWAWELVSV